MTQIETQDGRQRGPGYKQPSGCPNGCFVDRNKKSRAEKDAEARNNHEQNTKEQRSESWLWHSDEIEQGEGWFSSGKSKEFSFRIENRGDQGRIEEKSNEPRSTNKKCEYREKERYVSQISQLSSMTTELSLGQKTEPRDEITTIIGQYVMEELTLGQAADRAGVTRWEMQEILREAGVECRLGPETESDLREEVDTALGRDG